MDTWRSWNVDECLTRASKLNFEGRHWFLGPLPLLGATRVRLVKWQKCPQFHGGWFTGPRLRDVAAKEGDADVPILALYNHGSHGLDLAFVTHIFLLEPTHDSALMDQIVSRAYRCGATGPVRVVTIVVWDDDRHASGKVCDFCFKQGFATDALAEKHMRACSRNPKNRTNSDEFSMRKIFSQIKPPLKLWKNSDRVGIYDRVEII